MARVIENPTSLILETAKNILFSKGYSELNMRSVAKECNIATGTIYNYFPTKKDLIVEMMSGYWGEYLRELDTIINEDYSFYKKLELVFEKLSAFLKTFKEVWLRPELYESPDYIKTGLVRENLYMEKLLRLVEGLLETEAAKPASEIRLKQPSYDTAKFIVLNMITTIQMPIFSYGNFEVFLKELLS